MKKSKTFHAELRRSPAKAIVLVLALGLAFLSWNNSLFGEEEAPAWADMPVETGNVTAPTNLSLGNTVTSAEAVTPAIADFSSALERIENWQSALANQSLDAFELAESSAYSSRPEENGGSALARKMENISEMVPPIDLSLSGTALFGNSRFALFGQHRVQEGQRIGRYVVKAIRSREVDLLDGERLVVLRMADPELLARVTQSTEK
jgi:hypothetical protein